MELIADANYYQEQCMRFASDVSKASNDNLLLQGALGLCGECGEVVELVEQYNEDQKEHLVKELGDVLWYCATTSRGLDTYFSEIINAIDTISNSDDDDALYIYDRACKNAVDMSVEACAISDIMKKLIFHGHKLDANTMGDIRYRIITIVYYVFLIGQDYIDVSLAEIMTRNIEKLSARYPEGHFDTERSLHRKAGDI